MVSFIIICFALYALCFGVLLCLYANSRQLLRKLKNRESLFQAGCHYCIVCLLASAVVVAAETGITGISYLFALSVAILVLKSRIIQFSARFVSDD